MALFGNLLGGVSGKNPSANAGDIRDVGSIPGSERSPGGGHGNPLQYSCLENAMDRGAWHALVNRVAKSFTRLKQLTTHVALFGDQNMIIQDLWCLEPRRYPMSGVVAGGGVG